jgi:hypothetical protein
MATIMASAIGRSKWLAFLGQVGGRQVDRDVLPGQTQTHGVQRIAHALAALRHSLVGQPDDGEHVPAGAEAHLHLDRLGLDADERDGGDMPVHASPRIARATLMGAESSRRIT